MKENTQGWDKLARAFDAWAKEMKRAKDESFGKLENSLAHKKGVHDPAALAAFIGREHGKIK
jgi:hypothetical protein